MEYVRWWHCPGVLSLPSAVSGSESAYKSVSSFFFFFKSIFFPLDFIHGHVVLDSLLQSCLGSSREQLAYINTSPNLFYSAASHCTAVCIFVFASNRRIVIACIHGAQSGKQTHRTSSAVSWPSFIIVYYLPENRWDRRF